jgi:hypothetical protein
MQPQLLNTIYLKVLQDSKQKLVSIMGLPEVEFQVRAIIHSL